MRNHGHKQFNKAAPAISLIASFIERGAEKLQEAYHDEEKYSDEQLDSIIETIETNFSALKQAISPVSTKDV